MRPHGNAHVDASHPRAWAICDRCGFLYNHDRLTWQFQWMGPRIQNRRILVCPSCVDKLQENGLRTIILPADPIPIQNPRTEDYKGADQATVGAANTDYDPRNLRQATPTQGAFIGSMANLDAAFDGNLSKPMQFCCRMDPAVFGYQSWVGRNWTANPAGQSLTDPSAKQHTATSFSLVPPLDRPYFGLTPTQWQFQSSLNGISWNTLASGTTTGSRIDIAGFRSQEAQYHRVAFYGDSINPIGICQLIIRISDWPSPEQ